MHQACQGLEHHTGARIQTVKWYRGVSVTLAEQRSQREEERRLGGRHWVTPGMLPGLLNGSQGGLHRVKLKDSSLDPPSNDVTFKKWIDPGFNFTPHLVLEKPGGSQPSLAWEPAGRPQAVAARTFTHDVGVGPRRTWRPSRLLSPG